jgi:cytochrome c oxidase cbb3-type subunit 3
MWPRRWLATAAVALTLAAGGSLAWRDETRTRALLRADPERILADPTLAPFAIARGRTVFARECAACHGAEGRGGALPGAPDLTDADSLYDLHTVAAITQVVRFGIRSGNRRGWDLADMPAYATAIPYRRETLPSLAPGTIDDLVQFLRLRSGQDGDAVAAARGQRAYQGAGCWDCHGQSLEGDAAVGAPVLADGTWLYGGSAAAIRRSISGGRAGRMPAFASRLTPAELRAVSVYVAALPRRKP